MGQSWSSSRVHRALRDALKGTHLLFVTSQHLPTSPFLKLGITSALPKVLGFRSAAALPKHQDIANARHELTAELPSDGLQGSICEREAPSQGTYLGGFRRPCLFCTRKRIPDRRDNDRQSNACIRRTSRASTMNRHIRLSVPCHNILDVLRKMLWRLPASERREVAPFPLQAQLLPTRHLKKLPDHMHATKLLLASSSGSKSRSSSPHQLL